MSQNSDDRLRALRKELEEVDDAYFEMRNGVIYRKHKENLLFYVPQAMESHVINRYHDQLGHLGIEKTKETILKSYWFPNMRKKIEEYISNCLKCLSFSPPVGKVEGYLHSIPKGQLPFLMYHVDHYGPIDRQCLIKRYLLVVIDSFTKFTRLYPTKTVATGEVTKHLNEHFCSYSRPKFIVSDRGTAFTSGEFEEFCKPNDIQHIQVATHSPKANGQVERINRVIRSMLSKAIDKDEGIHWYKIIVDIEFALNNAVHMSTGETPSRLLFGVDQRGKVVDKIREYMDIAINDDNRDLVRLRTRAAEKIEKTQKYNKEYFDKRRKPAHVYKVEDLVLVKNVDTTKGVSRKIIPEFKGPYEVVRVLRNDRYVVRDIEGHQVTGRPYEGTWEAANMRLWSAKD